MKKLMDNKAKVQTQVQTLQDEDKPESPEPQKRDLQSLLKPIQKLDQGNVDGRVLNLLKITVVKEFMPRKEITFDQFDIHYQMIFKQGSLGGENEIIKEACKNEKGLLSLSVFRDLCDLYNQYPVIKKGDKNNSEEL